MPVYPGALRIRLAQVVEAVAVISR